METILASQVIKIEERAGYTMVEFFENGRRYRAKVVEDNSNITIDK